MIAANAKAWIAALVSLVLAAGTYAVAQDWAGWGIDQWRGLMGAALDALPQALAVAGCVWAVPNRQGAK